MAPKDLKYTIIFIHLPINLSLTGLNTGKIFMIIVDSKENTGYRHISPFKEKFSEDSKYSCRIMHNCLPKPSVQ